MATNNRKIQRFIHEDLAKLLDSMRIENFNYNLALGKKIKKFKPDWRITLAMVRHPKMKEIKKDIIMADLDLK